MRQHITMHSPNISDDSGEEKRMKKYIDPELEIVELDAKDIITTSLGTETTPKEENDGIWDLEIG